MYSQPFPVKNKRCFCVRYNDTILPMHFHQDTEIIYCVRGSITYQTANAEYRISDGQVLVIASGVKHRRLPSEIGKVPLGIYIKINQHLLGTGYVNFSALRFENPVLTLTDGSVPAEITELFQTIADIVLFSDEDKMKSCDADWIIQGAMLRFAAFLYAERPSHRVSSMQNGGSSDTQSRLQLALSYLEDNFSSDISVASAAAMTGYEISYFSKKFKQMTGMTFHQYLTEVRLVSARQLLATTEMSVQDIARSTGYPRLKDFCRIFKKSALMTPTAFRQYYSKKLPKKNNDAES